MGAVRFFDTNILVYAYDLKEPAKRALALGLIEDAWNDLEHCAISVQVLQEFYVSLKKRGIAQIEAVRLVEDFESWPVVNNTLDLFRAGIEEHLRWDLSLWDGLILAAARSVKAAEIVSEDFSRGQDYGGIRVWNPFVKG